MNSSTKISMDRKQEKRMYRSVNLAYIYLKNGEYAEAEKYAREFMALEPSDRGHKLLGDILRAQGKRDEALTEYEASLQLNPMQEEVLSLVSDLITPDLTNCERLALWASRAAKAGFLDVADKFRRSVDAAKATSFSSDSKLNRLLKDISINERTAAPKAKDTVTNGSPANQSRLSLDSVDCSFSGIDAKALPSPAQSRLPETLLKNMSGLQERLVKQVDAQNSKVLESNVTLLRAIGENRKIMLSLKQTVDVVLKELKDVRLSVRQVESRQKESSEAQQKLLDAFQTFQSLNEDYGDEEYEAGEYEDYGHSYEQENVPYPQPPQNHVPLSITTLPEFEVVFQKAKPASELVKKAESLQLPSNFFNYMEKEDCPGCRGCDTDDSNAAKPSVLKPAKSAFGKPVFGPPVPTPTAELTETPVSAESGVQSRGSAPAESPPKPAFSFVSPAASNAAPKPVFASGGSFTFGGSTAQPESAPISFGFKSAESPATGLFSGTPSVPKPLSTAGFVWGNDSSAATQTKTASAPIFGSSGPVTLNGKSADKEAVAGIDDGTKNESTDPKTPVLKPATGAFGKPVFGSPAHSKDTESTDVTPKTTPGALDLVSNSSETAAKSTFSFLAPTVSETASKPVFPPAGSFTFGGNTGQSDTTPISFGFKVPEGTGSGFFSSAGNATSSTAGTGFMWGNDNGKADWMKGSPAPIFGQKSQTALNGKSGDNEEDGDDDDGGEDEEYDPQYAPIVELPGLVQITTGEEDEEVVYCQRAKLFRFDKATKAWKERGIGDLKILKHRSKPRCRIVLRREQVHKIACNHYLTKEMKLTAMNNSETAVCWFAMDFAEEEPAEEQFAARFKTVELVAAFREKIESLQKSYPDDDGMMRSLEMRANAD